MKTLKGFLQMAYCVIFIKVVAKYSRKLYLGFNHIHKFGIHLIFVEDQVSIKIVSRNLIE